MGNPILFVSNGPTEDAIGAALAQRMGRPIWALPLVGEGKAYEGIAEVILGPRKSMPSGGFTFGSWANLLSDLKAGFLSMSLAQWRAARGIKPQAVVAVGDAYALSVGVWSGQGGPIYHVNPLVSAHYLEASLSPLELLRDWGGSDFTPYERFLHRKCRAVFVRDQKSLERIRSLGIPHSFYYGSFAMDLLPPPERDLSHLERPILALLPGTRGDEAHSLPLMLEASLHLDLLPVVAWAKAWEALPPLPGWRLVQHTPQEMVWEREGKRVWMLRGAFSAILHRALLVLATAGTASEQAAGLGKPVIGFPTPGPQYTRAFALRQKRLLGEALTLVEPKPERIAEASKRLLEDPTAYNRASQEGLKRIGPPGGIQGTASHIAHDLNPARHM